jgi:hypothetical protein
LDTEGLGAIFGVAGLTEGGLKTGLLAAGRLGTIRGKDFGIAWKDDSTVPGLPDDVMVSAIIKVLVEALTGNRNS